MDPIGFLTSWLSAEGHCFLCFINEIVYTLSAGRYCKYETRWSSNLWSATLGGALRLWGPGAILLRAVESLCFQSRSSVHTAGRKSDLFPVHVGLWQGCTLRQVVFIFFYGQIFSAKPGAGGLQVGNHKISSVTFTNDDVFLASSSQDFSMHWSSLQLNVKQPGRGRLALSGVGGNVLLQLEEFLKYLVFFFTGEGKWSVRWTGKLMEPL